MSGNDMNAEQGGTKPEGDFPPENTGSAEAIDTNQPDMVEAPPRDSISENTEKSDASRLEAVRQGLQFDTRGNFVMTPATAGGPSPVEDSKSQHVLNAQIPGRPVGERRAPVPRGVRGGRNPFGGIRGRVAAATIALGTMLGLGGAYVANQTDADTNNNPGGVPTQPVGETPGPDTKTPEPTSKPTEEPKTPTLEPTPTEVAQSPGSNGKYETVDQLPFDEARRNAIKELTKDSTPFIITDEGMVVIENSHLNGGDTVIYDGKEIKVSRLHSILLNTEKYPDAEERLNNALRQAKYDAWRYQSGNKDVTFEQYMATRNQTAYPFETYGYAGTAGKDKELADRKNGANTFIIIKILDDNATANILWSIQSEFQNEVIGDVLAKGIFMNDITGIGLVNRNGDEVKYSIGANLAVPLASLGGEKIGTGRTEKLSMANVSATLAPTINKIRSVLVPDYVDPLPQGTSTKDFESIFEIEGTSLFK